jgi:hypothetical protein
MEYNKKEQLFDKITGLMINNPCLKEKWINEGISEVFKRTEDYFNKELVPEVPQYVADWIEVCKEYLTSSLYLAMTPSFLKANNQSIELILWIKKKENQETFARAWLEGYEFEKEKKYIVKVNNTMEASKYLKYEKVVKNGILV